MELLHYLFKSGLVLGLFLLIYSLFLKKETHFQWHRFFLIIGVLVSFGLPLLVFTQVIYIPTPVIEQGIPLVKKALNTEATTIDWAFFIGFFYFLGVMVMSLRFFQQCYGLFKIISKSSAMEFENQPYLDSSVTCTPFSFFNYIIIHKNLHTLEELSMILTHENIHRSQHHSLDILLANLLLIVQWWNPMAWLYKKSMEENLEFIADTETIKEISCPKAYQYTLVKNTATTIQPALATHFYQSLIKKRIIMLNKTASSNLSRWKTILVVPLIALFFWTFNMEAQIKFEQHDQETTSYIVKAETTNKELKAIEKKFKSSKTQIKFTGIKRNKKKNITQINIKTRRSLANSFKHGMTLENKKTKGIETFSLHIDPSSSDIILSSLFDDHPYTATFSEKGSSAHLMDTDRTSKMLYIIEGEEISSEDVTAMNPNKIKSINVLKGNNATDKYGSKGVNGVVEITLKKTKEAVNLIPKNVLYVIDGLVSNSNNVAPNKIKKIVVLKGKKATDIYGDKAKEGAILITTKKD